MGDDVESEPDPGNRPGSSQGPGREPGEGPALERRCLAERGGTSNLEALWGRSPTRAPSLSRASKQLGAWRRTQELGETELRRGCLGYRVQR